MRTRALLASAALGIVVSSCGDEEPKATPIQMEAISALIDAELSDTEQRCMLEGLVESGIPPESVIDGSLGGEDDAELLAVAVECVDDLARIPAFVESFIAGAESEGTTLTDEQARCAIDALGEPDQTAAVTRCLDPGGTANSAGDLGLLVTACTDGNNQACDELYAVAPDDSDELELARTCAGRLPDSIGYRCSLDLDP